MADPSDPIAAALYNIAAARAQLDAAEAALTGRATATRPASLAAGNALPEPATDADLDGKWGNPQVRRDPPRWSGPSFVGATYADCPADYLETLAGFLAWQAGKAEEKNEMTNTGKPRAGYLRLDAARCLGWARRNAAKAPARPARPKPDTMNDPDDSEIPF